MNSEKDISEKMDKKEMQLDEVIGDLESAMNYMDSPSEEFSQIKSGDSENENIFDEPEFIEKLHENEKFEEALAEDVVYEEYLEPAVEGTENVLPEENATE